MLLAGKSEGVDKKEKNRRKIKQKSDAYPEFLGIVDVEDGRVLDLFIQEEYAEKDEQTGFQAGRQRVEAGRAFLEYIDDRYSIKK